MDIEAQFQTYVFNKDRAFYVSTVERDSSAMIEPPAMRYMETIVWDWNAHTKKRGRLLYQIGDGAAAIQHFNVCRQLYFFGEYDENMELTA